MALNIYNIKKWYKMLTGQGYLYVNQNIGRCFSTKEICGYYNNLTEKVTVIPELLKSDKLPMLYGENNQWVYFPVAIFQYGLGAYDLYLETNDEIYKNKFIQCLNWAIEHQESNGAWNNFFYIYPSDPYGAMAQGEGVSLLLRGYKLTNEDKYLNAAQLAIDFMLLPLEKGGTTKYRDSDIFLLEYTHLPLVLNGFIFAWFGLYDFCLTKPKDPKYNEILEKSKQTIIRILPNFSNSFGWSIYDTSQKIASPFYHNLHIGLMKAMHELTNESIFKKYADIWEKAQKNIVKKNSAFIIKAYQKIKE